MIASDARRAPLALAPDSLYIVTQPLLHGAFHWSLVLTPGPASVNSNPADARNEGPTRHHWARPARGPGYETYRMQRLGAPACATPSAAVLAYFRVRGYTPMELDAFCALCARAFAQADAEEEEGRNRNERGRTCRTWVTAVLADLRECGSLEREAGGEGADADSDMATESGERETSQVELEIESRARERSRELDAEYATSFLWNRTYETRIETV